jgi:hypothetical protein
MAALKNTLTEAQLENGAQVYPMRTKAMLLLTNKKPQDVVEFVDEASQNSIAALMERFPLHMIVEWDSYESRDYMGMFVSLEEAMDGCPGFTFKELVELRQWVSQVRIPREVLAVLTELVAEANEQSGGIISPRTAVHARDLIAAAAVINGRDVAEEADIIAVKYLPGMEAIATTIEQKIEAASNRAKAEGLLTDGFRIVGTLQALLERRKGNFQFMLAVMALLRQLEDEVDDMIRPPRELQDRKQALLDQIREVFRSAGVKAEYMAQAMVVLPEQMLGSNWKVKVEKSTKTLAQQLLEKEEAERLAQYEAENGDDWDDEWDQDQHEDEEYYDYDEEEVDEPVDFEVGEDVVNRLRNRTSPDGRSSRSPFRRR